MTTKHSPLGASGAERWMNCPGSVGLLKELVLPETDEPDYRKEGTAAHEAIARCLTENLDGWEVIGEEFNGVKVDVPMADAIQVYFDTVRAQITPTSKVLIEVSIAQPQVHKDFYGTVDCAVINGNRLFVNDYKHGQGVVVEVEDNPQLMYYAYGLLVSHPEVEWVELRIIQPRGFHPDGPVRRWLASADYIRSWAENSLIPAMLRTEMDNDFDAGKWCRFCPAKLVCPLMNSLFGAAMKADPRAIVNLSDEAIGRSYQYTEAVKQYLKALEEDAMRRLNTGREIIGIKLVHKKANRVFKDGAKDVFTAKFGNEAYTSPELKSPAEFERMGADAKALVHEWAYTPQTGLTVVLEGDKRPAVKVQQTAEAFPNAAQFAA